MKQRLLLKTGKCAQKPTRTGDEVFPRAGESPNLEQVDEGRFMAWLTRTLNVKDIGNLQNIIPPLRRINYAILYNCYTGRNQTLRDELAAFTEPQGKLASVLSGDRI